MDMYGQCMDIPTVNIIVPDTDCPLTDDETTSLRDAVNPRAASQSFGCDIYIATVQFCEQFLSLWKNWIEICIETYTHSPWLK